MSPQGTAPAPRAEQKLATYLATDTGKTKTGFNSTDRESAANITYYAQSAIRTGEKKPDHKHQFILTRRNVSNVDGSPALDSRALVVNSVRNNQVIGRTSSHEISGGRFDNGDRKLKDDGLTTVDLKILFNDGENPDANYMRAYHRNGIIKKVEFIKKF